MNKVFFTFLTGLLLASIPVWADQPAASTTPSTGAPSMVATPKPLPADVIAARDKWLDAKAQEIQAGHDLQIVKLGHHKDHEQESLAQAQAKNDSAKVAKCQAKLTALLKIQADEDQILSLKLDRIKDLKASDKSDALNDTDQIKSVQADIKAQWQSMK
jgi:hypothetical protein